MYLRRVKQEDCELLYKWANDSAVRENAFNSNPIEFSNHLIWFNNKLDSKKSFVFILIENELPIGQIRLDLEESLGVIDYSIDEEFRGRGYGFKILELLEKHIVKFNIRIDKLIGKVKYSNIPSQRAFEKNNYSILKREQYIIYCKEIRR